MNRKRNEYEDHNSGKDQNKNRNGDWSRNQNFDTYKLKCKTLLLT